MSIAWTTIVVLFLLSPGFLFFLGLLSPDRLSRDVTSHNIYGQLASVVIISLFVHTLLLLSLQLLGQYCANLREIDLSVLFALLQFEQADNVSLSRISDTLQNNLVWILLYSIFSVAIGFYIGVCTSHLILDHGLFHGWLPHRWAIELQVTNKNPRLVYAYVMTKIHFQDNILMYYGLVKETYINKDGTLNYIVLDGADRYYIPITPQNPHTQTMEHDQQSHVGLAQSGSGESANFLVIDGEDIANVVYQVFDLQPPHPE